MSLQQTAYVARASVPDRAALQAAIELSASTVRSMSFTCRSNARVSFPAF